MSKFKTSFFFFIPSVSSYGIIKFFFSYFFLLLKLWDSVSSPQSTLSSTLISIQGSSEDSSQEPSPNSYDFCWNSTYDVVEMLEKMKLDERDSSKYNPGYGNHRLEISNVGACSLLHEQILSLIHI